MGKLALLKKTLGVLLIALGIIGLLLPFLQGILFILLGLALLGNKRLNEFFLKILKKTKENKKSIFILVRYIILLGLMFTLSLVYKIFLPLTLYPVAYLLKLFYQVTIIKDIIVVELTPIQIVSACVAGSAYLLLLILNLSVRMKQIKRIYTILLSFLILLILNILRIFLLSVLLVNQFQFFDFTHKLFWYALSTIFVIGIWFLMVKLFSIKEIPVYTDLKFLSKHIRR